MKLTTKREDLVSKLSTVSRAVSTRAATQALSGVLLRAADGKVTLAATDLDLGLETTLEASIESEGSVLLPGRLFAEVARSLADAEVAIESREAERDVEIRSGSSSFHLRVLPVEDFPKLPQPGETPGLKIPSPALEASIELVARAASRDDMRPVLTGVFVSASGKEMTMVATDSYRLAVKRTELENELGGEIEANIPARALRELSRILSTEGAGEATISLMTNQAVFEAGSMLLSTRLIDGQFPNFRQLLPESYEHDVRLVRSDFLDVTRRVSQLAQRNAPLRLKFESGELTVAAETPDVGDAEETMPAAFEGEALEIGFNPEFLRDGIESIAGDEVMLRLISPLRPGLLEPVEGDDFRYLVMPIRLNV
ncbi:MAG TPA: DNA polymerase III subunit beta [Solirubrobacterales bacterium]|nr:DNA polymerase III subunit beta [Solirubrobacterales bacterium]